MDISELIVLLLALLIGVEYVLMCSGVPGIVILSVALLIGIDSTIILALYEDPRYK